MAKKNQLLKIKKYIHLLEKDSLKILENIAWLLSSKKKHYRKYSERISFPSNNSFY